MPKFTNREALMVVLPALRELGRLKTRAGNAALSMKGALRVRKIRKAFEVHQKDLQAVKEEKFEEYAELDEKGKVKTEPLTNTKGEVQKDQRGNPVGEQAILRKGEDGTDAEAKAAFNEEWNALMEEEFEHKWGIGMEHLPKDDKETGQNIISADLLFRLGNLIEDPEDKEKNR